MVMTLASVAAAVTVVTIGEMRAGRAGEGAGRRRATLLA